MLFKSNYYKSKTWKELNSSEKRLVTYYITMANKDQECYPSVKTISEDISMDKETVFITNKLLTSKNIISISNRSGTSNLYHIDISLFESEVVENPDMGYTENQIGGIRNSVQGVYGKPDTNILLNKSNNISSNKDNNILDKDKEIIDNIFKERDMKKKISMSKLYLGISNLKDKDFRTVIDILKCSSTSQDLHNGLINIKTIVLDNNIYKNLSKQPISILPDRNNIDKPEQINPKLIELRTKLNNITEYLDDGMRNPEYMSIYKEIKTLNLNKGE